MAPLRASTTKSEELPDDPTGFVPSRLWKLPSITTWDDSRNQNHPTDSAEEAQKRISSASVDPAGPRSKSLDFSNAKHQPPRVLNQDARPAPPVPKQVL